MNTETTVNSETVGWIFYDADCSLCARSAIWFNRMLDRHGFRLLPLQTPGAADRVGVTPETLFDRMHLLKRDGRRFDGADAFVEIARHLNWARPIVAASELPGVLPLLRRCYDWIAAHRYCLGGTCRLPRRPSKMDWLPLIVLPIGALALRNHLANWVFMWAMALALYAGCKWVTYRNAIAVGRVFETRRALGYLLGWIGMEPVPFWRETAATPTPRHGEWLVALMRVLLGIGLVWGGVRLFYAALPLAAGWMGMFGIILLLHFGLFHWLALAWQSAGVSVKPLMCAPLRSTSLGDLWGNRWNTGFHTLAHEFVFRPACHRVGKVAAVLTVFVISGLIHELVITLPAHGGYGLPTAYFLLQGLGLVLERSALGARLGLATGLRGRIFAILIAAAPAFWLFPPVFVRNVILPMLHAIGAT